MKPIQFNVERICKKYSVTEPQAIELIKQYKLLDENFKHNYLCIDSFLDKLFGDFEAFLKDNK